MAPSVTTILMLLTLPDAVREQFADGVRSAFPDCVVHMVRSVAEIDPYLPTADVLITFGPHLLDRADYVLRNAPRLRWVQALGTGVDNIVDQPGLGGGTILTNMRGLHGPAMSEAAIHAMLMLSRNAVFHLRNQTGKAWQRVPSRLLNGKTVGILGLGVIAAELGPRCKALGLRVIGFSSSPRALAGFDRVCHRRDLLAEVPNVDYLLLLTPYTPDTHHLIGRGVLAAMKPTSYLINLARGGVVDEGALIERLRAKRIAGAALDVFATEPLPADHPFWAMANVIVTPHVGALHDGYARDALPIVLENIRLFNAGYYEQMLNRVDR